MEITAQKLWVELEQREQALFRELQEAVKNQNVLTSDAAIIGEQLRDAGLAVHLARSALMVMRGASRKD